MNSQLIKDLESLHDNLDTLQTSTLAISEMESLADAIEQEDFSRASAKSAFFAALDLENNPFKDIKEFSDSLVSAEDTSKIKAESQLGLENAQKEYEARVNAYVEGRIGDIRSAAKAEVEQFNKDLEEKKTALGSDPKASGCLFGLLGYFGASAVFTLLFDSVGELYIVALIIGILAMIGKRVSVAPKHKEWQAKLDQLVEKNTADVNAVNAKCDAACEDLNKRRAILFAAGSDGQPWADDEDTDVLVKFEAEYNEEVERIRKKEEDELENCASTAQFLRTSFEGGLRDNMLAVVAEGRAKFVNAKNVAEATIQEINPELGAKYLNLGIVATLLEYARDGRADSYKDAVNLYERDLQHEAMMKQQYELKQQEIRAMELQAEMDRRQQELQAEQQFAQQQALIEEQRRANEIQAAHNQAMLEQKQAAAEAAAQAQAAQAQQTEEKAKRLCECCANYEFIPGAWYHYQCNCGWPLYQDPNCPMFRRAN